MNKRILFFTALTLTSFGSLTAQQLPQAGKASDRDVISAMTRDGSIGFVIRLIEYQDL